LLLKAVLQLTVPQWSPPDVEASNGVIHVIDTVMLPPSLDLSTLQ